MLEHLHLYLPTQWYGRCGSAFEVAGRRARVSGTEGEGLVTFETVDFTNLKLELRGTYGADAAQGGRRKEEGGRRKEGERITNWR